MYSCFMWEFGCFFNPTLVLVALLLVKGYHNRNIMLIMCLCLIISNCSLRHNQITATGAIALAEALQQNWSLEELQYVKS